ncbi:MAG: iron-containing alcohol dehydrogenase family protein [Firmicutes bacterium]|nr:iron-containing alcohol dehydrogenase family protein [Bacillota bacterium]
MQRKISPGIYVREPGILGRVGDYCGGEGNVVALVGGNTALAVAKDQILSGCREKGINVSGVHWYGGECSPSNVQSLVREIDSSTNIIIGVGGGKALDTAKAVAFQLDKPVITVPTIAATCAPWTPLSVTYTDEGVFIELSPQAQTPAAVLVDSSIIAAAPVRLLAAGVGDTLAKWYEVDTTSRNLKSAVIFAARETALLCRQVLLDHGEDAVHSVQNKTVSFALDQVIDGIIMLSGMVSGLGGDQCRTAGAHAIYSGLTYLPQVHQMYHGETVAFGILGQLMLEERLHDAQDLAARLVPMGLPVTLKQLGVIDPSEKELALVGKGAVDAEDMNNMPFKVTPGMVEKAILAADNVGRTCLR